MTTHHPFPERLRRATLFMGALAAAGIAEQHHDPAPLIADIPGALWPSAQWNVWSISFLICAVVCLMAGLQWPTRTNMMRLAAVLLASVTTARAVGLFTVYGLDLWGTVARNLLTAALIVASWSWTGSTLRSIPEAE